MTLLDLCSGAGGAARGYQQAGFHVTGVDHVANQQDGGHVMKQPRGLDLFCGAGGSSMGYHQAGFEMTGVDIHPQPRYPFQFIQADALEYVATHGHLYDVIFASPPCQAYSRCTPVAHRAHHPRLIAAVRLACQLTGKPYVLENVADARGDMPGSFLLCGSMVGLPIWRHRYFETTAFPFPLMLACNHSGVPVLISGTMRRTGQPRREYSLAEKRAAIGIDWMTGKEIDEAIPPAYTRWIGEQIRHRLTAPRPPDAEETPWNMTA